jgi:hypothetical protein
MIDDDLFIVSVLPSHDEAIECIQHNYALELSLRARLDELINEARCPCAQQEPRTRVFCNGGMHYVMQCLACGKHVRTLRRDEVDLRREALGNQAFDESLVELGRLSSAWRVDEKRAERETLSRQIWQAHHAQYKAYLLTDDWRAKRRQRLAHDHYQCQERLPGCCGNASQVHHVTYDRLFDEGLDDLLSVCERCHRTLHALADRYAP